MIKIYKKFDDKMENFSRDLETIKNQMGIPELKNIITEINNSIRGFKS